LLQTGKGGIDLFIERHIHWQDNVTAHFPGDIDNTILEAIVLVSEGKLGTFPMHCVGNTIGDGALSRQSDDERAFASKKSHAIPHSWR
jgi:hypothetical protein